jgi:hypothetical protein
MREANAAFGRIALISLILVAVFELLARAAISKVSIGPFEIADLSLVQKGLPVAVAYAFYDYMSIGNYIVACFVLHNAVLEYTSPEMINRRLDYFLAPRAHSLTGSELFTDFPGKRSFTNYASNYFFLVTAFLGAAFQVYAYYVLFRQFHFTDVLVWVGLALSVFFLIYGISAFRDFEFKINEYMEACLS